MYYVSSARNREFALQSHKKMLILLLSFFVASATPKLVSLPRNKYHKKADEKGEMQKNWCDNRVPVW